MTRERGANDVPRSPRPRRTRARPVRDQDQSTFSAILEKLVHATPGADGAALVDAEGETVDYAGNIDPFELKVAAAHWQIVLGELAEGTKIDGIRQITVRAQKRSYIVRPVPSKYAIVLVLHRYASFAASERALQEADSRLSLEAGWPMHRDTNPWCSIDVETELRDRNRPARVHVTGAWHTVEVMGSMVGLRPGERGFRVRLPTGVEMLLVRERHGRWFADERMDG